MYDITIITTHIAKNIKAIKAPSPFDLMGLVLCLVITFSNVVVSKSLYKDTKFQPKNQALFYFFYLVETIFFLLFPLCLNHFTNIVNFEDINKHFFYLVETFFLFPLSFRLIVSKNFTNIVNFEDIRKHFFTCWKLFHFLVTVIPLSKSLYKYTHFTYTIQALCYFFLPYGDAGAPAGKIRNLPIISKHFISITTKIVLVYVVEIVYICTVIETPIRGAV